MSDESKITEFPLEKSGGGEEELWKCQACKHIITERMDELNLDKSKVLPLNTVSYTHLTLPTTPYV